MPELAYVNGKIMPIEQAQTPIEDRGYLFGDAVYEFIASTGGRPFMLEAHLDRLDRSMAGLQFPALDRGQIRQAILTLFERAGFQRAGLYLQISRGVAPRYHPFPAAPIPQVIMTIRAVTDMAPAVRQHGVAVMSTPDQRWGRCDLKTVQLLANVLAKQRALDAGYADAIFIGPDGTVREGTSSNVFMVQGGALATHPLTPHILPGITRLALLDICRQRQWSVSETFFSLDDLKAADEVFLTGTLTEVLPVIRVDETAIGSGQAGPIAIELQQALLQQMACT